MPEMPSHVAYVTNTTTLIYHHCALPTDQKWVIAM